MPLARLLNVVDAWVRGRLEAACSAASFDKKAHAEAMRRLADYERLMAWPVDAEEEREQWGTGADAEASQNAMLALIGSG